MGSLGPERDPACLLLFSGGRDSTLAALQLATTFTNIILLTATSPHLVGIDHVLSRLSELGRYLNGDTLWLQATFAADIPIRDIPGMDLCLPCRQTYFAVAVKIANDYGVGNIAVGYTSYQSGWLEQSPYAISSLRRVLRLAGKELLLPVAEIS